VTAELRVRCGGQDVAVPVELKPGPQTCEARLTIPAPRLWWPIGHGDQHRYLVETALTIDGQVVASHTSQVGFRHLHIDQSPCPAGGQWFFLEVNCRRIFCKGGNYVPADTVIAAIDVQRSRRLVELARDQHFNLLRVWGGGRYEDLAFYEACDELGILVWQEFIFACSRYPGTDGAFYNEIEAEATYQVRRLATHPSLFTWCGNNENEWAAHDWGYAKGNPLPDHQLYHHLLPLVVAREDGSRWWQPSSPYSPDHLPPLSLIHI
jgi:beta-mannosidase